MVGSVDFQNYLRSLATRYTQWQNFYTPSDVEGKEQVKQQHKSLGSPFDFGLIVQTKALEREQEERQKVGRFPVLEEIRKYAAEMCC